MLIPPIITNINSQQNFKNKSSNEILHEEIESDNQIFYQNINFRKNIFKKRDLTKQTLTNFTKHQCLSVRTIKYNRSKIKYLINDSVDYDGKQVDINLQGLYNHYIFCKTTWKLYCSLSIAQIAIFVTVTFYCEGTHFTSTRDM